MKVEFICLQPTELGKKIAAFFGVLLQEAQFLKFSDNEINVTLRNNECFKDKTAVIIQSTDNPVNELVLGVSFLAQELKNAGAVKVIAIIPYFGYSRQERSVIPEKPGPAKVIAKMFESAGIDELITVELHDKKITTFFSIPVHNILIQSFFVQHIKKQQELLADVCLVAPDKGASLYVQKIAEKLGVGSLVFSKVRFAADQTRIVDMFGYCQASIGIVIDDIIATGGTATDVAHELLQHGYRLIIGYFVHPVLVDNIQERLKSGGFEQVYVSNTLPLPIAMKNNSFIKQFDISPIIIDTLQKIINVCR